MRTFAQQSKEKIKDIQESYMAKADDMNKMLAEKHQMELMAVENEKIEIERELKEQILKVEYVLYYNKISEICTIGQIHFPRSFEGQGYIVEKRTLA